jgi:uncharacterized protein
MPILYQGKWALITGASSGFGEEFAKALAQKGTNLVLVARREQKLSAIATTLIEKYHVQVEVIAMDLATPSAGLELYLAVKKLQHHIHILINNAGFGLIGKLHDIDIKKNQDMMMLNIVTPTNLIQLFLPDMLSKKEGVIINLASTAAFLPTPYMAIYGATKAFVLSLTEGIWAEYRKMGINVLAVCPGSSSTEFFKVAGAEIAPLLKKSSPEEVVRSALKALDCGKIYVIPGSIANYVLANLVRFSPRKLAALVSESIMRPR